MSYIIQARYDFLANATQALHRDADSLQQLISQIEHCVEALHSGDWRGTGSQAFFHEMSDLVIPAERRLLNALLEAAKAIECIAQMLREAEEEAGSLFRGGSGFGGMFMRTMTVSQTGTPENQKMASELSALIPDKIDGLPGFNKDLFIKHLMDRVDKGDLDRASVENLINLAKNHTGSGPNPYLTALGGLAMSDVQNSNKDPNAYQKWAAITGLPFYNGSNTSGGGTGTDCANFASFALALGGQKISEPWKPQYTQWASALNMPAYFKDHAGTSPSDNPQFVGLDPKVYDSPAAAVNAMMGKVGPGDIVFSQGKHVAVVAGYGPTDGGSNQPFFPTLKEAEDHYGVGKATIWTVDHAVWADSDKNGTQDTLITGPRPILGTGPNNNTDAAIWDSASGYSYLDVK